MAKKNNDILLLAGIQSPDRIRETFELIIRLGLVIMGADEGSLLILRKAEHDLQFAANVGSSSPDALIGKTVPLGKGVTGMAAMLGEVQTASRGIGNFFRVENDGAPNSVIAAPVMLDDELIGVITAVSFAPGKEFSSRDCQVYSMLAQLGAIVISQEQKLSNYASEKISHITEQDTIEMMAAQKAIDLVRRHSGDEQRIIQILSLLSELK